MSCLFNLLWRFHLILSLYAIYFCVPHAVCVFSLLSSPYLCHAEVFLIEVALRSCDDDECRVCVSTCCGDFTLILALSTFVVLAYVRCGALHYVDIGLLNEE